MEYERAFAVVANDTYFPGLEATLGSIYAYYGQEIRVFVVGHCLSQEKQHRLDRHPLGGALTYVDTHSFARMPFGCWVAKQQVPSELVEQVHTLCLLDADLILLSRVDDVFEFAERGKIVGTLDVGDIEYGGDYGVYSPKIVGVRHPYMNSGFLALNLRHHWDLVGLWEFTSRFGHHSRDRGAPFHFPGHGDQGLLNALMAHLGLIKSMEILPEKTWCNSAGWHGNERVSIAEQHGDRLVVMAEPLGQRQRVLHSTGPKWWTLEGRRHFQPAGDIVRCFETMAAISRRAS